MERLISWWANNAVAANLLMAGIVLAGILGFVIMERETFPSFKPSQVKVEVVCQVPHHKKSKNRLLCVWKKP